MKKLLLLALLSVCVGVAGADVPDPDQSDCGSWDVFGRAFVTPGTCSSVDCFTVTVLNQQGNPIADSPVEIDLSQCAGLCICDPDGLTGTTDGNGQVDLCPAAGGCDLDCTVTVKASGVTICILAGIVSTDWDGAAANCSVSGADFAFFAAAFQATQDDCADYNGSTDVTGTDFSFFATSFQCPDNCTPQ